MIKHNKGKNKGGALGPGGYCICAKCGEKIPHEQGVIPITYQNALYV